MRNRLIAATAAVAVVVVAVGIYLVLQGREPRRPIRIFSRVPNIVLINTDDMRLDSLSAMPTVRRLLGDHGVTFTNASDPWLWTETDDILTVTGSVESRDGRGGTSPARVAEQLDELRAAVADLRGWNPDWHRDPTG